VNGWATRHRAILEAVLDNGEELRAADRVIVRARRRRRPSDMPRAGFVLAVTDKRLIAFTGSRWLTRPQRVVASWPFVEGYKLAPASALSLGRVHLVLPDRSVVTLAPFGGRSLAHLAVV
jgi:hypothetical protein